MDYIYGEQAQILIDSLKSFDKEDFIKWRKKNNIYITYVTYLEFIVFLKSKDKIKDFEQKIRILEDVKIDIELFFSEALQTIIENTNVNIELLKKFYLFSHKMIGDQHILTYLNKDKTTDTNNLFKKVLKDVQQIKKDIESLKAFFKSYYDQLKNFNADQVEENN